MTAQFHRLAARQGNRRAAVAVAHSILIIAYHMIRDGTCGGDLTDLPVNGPVKRVRAKVDREKVDKGPQVW